MYRQRNSSTDGSDLAPYPPLNGGCDGVRIIKLDAKDKVTAIAMIGAETEETEHA